MGSLGVISAYVSEVINARSLGFFPITFLCGTPSGEHGFPQTFLPCSSNYVFLHAGGGVMVGVPSSQIVPANMTVGWTVWWIRRKWDHPMLLIHAALRVPGQSQMIFLISFFNCAQNLFIFSSQHRHYVPVNIRGDDSAVLSPHFLGSAVL